MFNPAATIGDNMANILGARFNPTAISYASNYGLSLDTQSLSEADKARMRQARAANLADNITLGDASTVRETAHTQVVQAAAMAAQDLAQALGGVALFNGKNRKWYFRGPGFPEPTANWTKMRKDRANTPEFFDYRWRMVINYNKLAGAVTAGAKFASKGWTGQDIMNARAKSAWKGLLKKAAQGFNPGAKAQESLNKATTRIQNKYDNMASAIGFIKSAANSSGGGTSTFVQRPKVGVDQFNLRFNPGRSDAGSTQAYTPPLIFGINS